MPRRTLQPSLPSLTGPIELPPPQRGRSGRPPTPEIMQKRKNSTESSSSGDEQLFRMDSFAFPQPERSITTPELLHLHYARRNQPSTPREGSSRRHSGSFQTILDDSPLPSSSTTNPISVPRRLRRRVQSDVHMHHEYLPTSPTYLSPPQNSSHRPYYIHASHWSDPSVSYPRYIPASTTSSPSPHLVPSPHDPNHFSATHEQWVPTPPMPSPPVLTSPLPEEDEDPITAHSMPSRPVRVPIQRTSRSYVDYHRQLDLERQLYHRN
ncbi:hypothetical protein DL96DRAFT_1714075 [Flagelloscypha sp. PMI_526]|nr:hypothetical protein DL96DRAFT_1714075 [Flagelloscypha sp. PMI_526]